MSNVPVQRKSPSLWPDMLEWFTGFPFWCSSMSRGQAMRLEDETKDGRYIIRAELPGIDPAKDVDITVADGVLTIKAERSETTGSQTRSEFSYGSFVRCITLPPAPMRTTSQPPTTRESSLSRLGCREVINHRTRNTLWCRRSNEPIVTD